MRIMEKLEYFWIRYWCAYLKKSCIRVWNELLFPIYLMTCVQEYLPWLV